MCGRFTQSYTWEEVVTFLTVVAPAVPQNLQPRYNIGPTTLVDVIIDRGNGRELVKMRWGLVPSWWKKTAREVGATFNARGEDVANKPMFRSLFKQKRCIIPANGFYEWTGPKTDRQPHYFTRIDGKIMAFAGLWDGWKDPETGGEIMSCSIITTQASKWMAAFHNRMPAVLFEEDFDAWLKGTAGPEVLRPARTISYASGACRHVSIAPGVDDDDSTLTDPV